jgi:hypothetical protein
MIVNAVLYLFGFLVLIFVQGVVINGIFESFNGDMIFSPIKRWLNKNVSRKWILKPLVNCIKCASSFWGAVTFFPTVLILFGWHWQELPVFVFDVFALVNINFFIYKNV